MRLDRRDTYMSQGWVRNIGEATTQCWKVDFDEKGMLCAFERINSRESYSSSNVMEKGKTGFNEWDGTETLEEAGLVLAIGMYRNFGRDLFLSRKNQNNFLSSTLQGALFHKRPVSQRGRRFTIVHKI